MTYFQRMTKQEKEEDLHKLHKKYNSIYHKFDGTHVDLIFYENEPIRLLTREGNDVAHLVPYITEEIENSLNMFPYQGVYACELVNMERVHNAPQEAWSATRKVLGRKQYEPTLPKLWLVIYDMYENFRVDTTEMSYSNRRLLMPKPSLTPHSFDLDYVYRVQGDLDYVYIPRCYPIEDLEIMWRWDVLTEKREGFVLFQDDAHVPFNKTFAKLKPKIELDAFILRIIEGKKGTKLEGRVGAFEVGVFKGYETISLGKVPTMTEEERTKWDIRLQKMKDNPRNFYNDNKKELIVGEDIVIQVKASELTLKNKLRFGSYMRLREDKKSIECDFEQLL